MTVRHVYCGRVYCGRVYCGSADPEYCLTGAIMPGFPDVLNQLLTLDSPQTVLPFIHHASRRSQKVRRPGPGGREFGQGNSHNMSTTTLRARAKNCPIRRLTMPESFDVVSGTRDNALSRLEDIGTTLDP